MLLIINSHKSGNFFPPQEFENIVDNNILRVLIEQSPHGKVIAMTVLWGTSLPSPSLKCFVLFVHTSHSRDDSLLLAPTFILDAIATDAVVSKIIAVFLFRHPVFDWSGLAAVQGKSTNARIIMYPAKTCWLRDEILLGVNLRPLKT